MDIKGKIVLVGQEKTSQKGSKYRAVTIESNGNRFTITAIGIMPDTFKEGEEYDFYGVKEGEYKGEKQFSYYFTKTGGAGYKKGGGGSYNQQCAARCAASILQGQSIDEWQRFGEMYDYILDKINGKSATLPAKKEEHIPF